MKLNQETLMECVRRGLYGFTFPNEDRNDVYTDSNGHQHIPCRVRVRITPLRHLGQ